jgi:hypothetical protein
MCLFSHFSLSGAKIGSIIVFDLQIGSTHHQLMLLHFLN